MRIASLRSRDLALVVDDGLVPVGAALVRQGLLPEPSMRALVERYAALQPALRELAARADRVPFAAASLAAPLAQPSKIWAAASNYRRGTASLDGARGRGTAPAESPEAILDLAFLKPPSAIIGPGENIVIPPGAGRVFPELELCVVVGREASNVSAADALDVVFGYTVILDVTARQFGASQNQLATRCVRKGFDTFAPLGPWLVTRDEVPDPERLALRLAVDGELVQAASTDGMINGVAALISYLSRVSTLYPGDLIATGNPDAPEFQRPLAPGDRLAAEIESIGTLEVGVVGAA
ncbi:MAG TPA: fumarylacetoacetate hydrolase family protein [Chloroflexota bacterium]|nr:fumarylacetoacetate hydrolase family protein [Chloroflexota bacterium]